MCRLRSNGPVSLGGLEGGTWRAEFLERALSFFEVPTGMELPNPPIRTRYAGCRSLVIPGGDGINGRPWGSPSRTQTRWCLESDKAFDFGVATRTLVPATVTVGRSCWAGCCSSRPNCAGQPDLSRHLEFGKEDERPFQLLPFGLAVMLFPRHQPPIPVTVRQAVPVVQLQADGFLLFVQAIASSRRPHAFRILA